MIFRGVSEFQPPGWGGHKTGGISLSIVQSRSLQRVTWAVPQDLSALFPLQTLTTVNNR